MFEKLLPLLTPLNMVLIFGIVWLSGVFLWLIRKFVSSYEKNTEINTKLQGTMEAVDRKLDTAAERDLRVAETLAAINAKQDAKTAEIHVVPAQQKK